ncbi:MAG: hypothetical protein KDK45_08795 [Leptospiraceae bacterium]|nr:hypothetical protein [Leptospiraceae bacterium]
MKPLFDINQVLEDFSGVPDLEELKKKYNFESEQISYASILKMDIPEDQKKNLIIFNLGYIQCENFLSKLL